MKHVLAFPLSSQFRFHVLRCLDEPINPHAVGVAVGSELLIDLVVGRVEAY